MSRSSFWGRAAGVKLNAKDGGANGGNDSTGGRRKETVNELHYSSFSYDRNIACKSMFALRSPPTVSTLPFFNLLDPMRVTLYVTTMLVMRYRTAFLEAFHFVVQPFPRPPVHCSDTVQTSQELWMDCFTHDCIARELKIWLKHPSACRVAAAAAAAAAPFLPRSATPSSGAISSCLAK